MELTRKTINEALAPLLGQNASYAGMDVQSALRQLLLDFAESHGMKPEHFRAEPDRSCKWTFRILYRGYDVCSVDVKRSKGRSHYGILGGHYVDYAYKDFKVSLWGDEGFGNAESVMDRLEYIDKLVDKKSAQEADKKRKAEDIRSYVMETYGVDKYAASELLKAAANVW